jgi:ABC-type lipoprotein export system ATPase subunit
MNKPAILFCDEPTGNLDSHTGEEIIKLIRKVNTQEGMTVLLVTHNLELAASADRVYHLKDGILAN